MQADYGVDAPGLVRNFLLIGTGLLLVGKPIPYVGTTLLITGGIFLVQGLAMLLYAKGGKFNHRKRMLGLVEWKGNETVLDIGTGRGLLMIGAAKKLNSGKAYGIDIWNAEDLSSNSIQNTLKNIQLEGVEGKAEVRNEDVQKMSFADNTFDVILSNLCVHNIYNAEGRAKACREIARVLKPGGVALISDFKHTKDYAEEFRKVGLESKRLPLSLIDTYFPLWIVKAAKA